SLKYLNIIREEANRSLNIITDFLEFNKIKIVKTEIDLNLLLEDVYDSFKIILNRKNIKLIYNDREDEEIYFDGDYERLKQVLINVLKNSVEAIKDKGKVEISSNIYKRHIDIIIEDDGIGMSEETLKQLKTMFFTTKLNGSGLGVCLSNEIIKAHNGELIYTSKEGVGTKVTIRLPK
ncbi:MAG: ATP-binding protein, partial [Bacilli bacterium]|nr:ATP-binding protein [Bacilli bacterium]